MTLTWSEFKDILEKTFPVVDPIPDPPTAAAIRSAEYRGRVSRGALVLEGTLQVDVLAKGWVALPLWQQGAVASFECAGATVERRPDGLYLLARGPAQLTVRASIAFPMESHPGVNHADLYLPGAGRNVVDLSMSGEAKELAADAGLVVRGDAGHLFLALPDGHLAFHYSLPLSEQRSTAGQEIKQEPRVHLQASLLLDLGEGVMRGLLLHDYQVRLAEVDAFEILVPEGVEVFDCTAPGLESWKILLRDGKKVLHVAMGAPVSGNVRVAITFEGAYDPKKGEVNVPRFAPLSVEREWGFAAFSAEGAELKMGISGNLLPADVSEIPADVRAFGGNLLDAYKYTGAPSAALVQVTEHDDAAVLTAIVPNLVATTVLLEDGTEATWIHLSVRNNRKQFLKMTLPTEGTEVWSLLIDNEPAKPKQSGREVLIPLTSGSQTESGLDLVLLNRGRKVKALGKNDPVLPALDVPVSNESWTVYFPRNRRLIASKKVFTVDGTNAGFFRRYEMPDLSGLFSGAKVAGGYASYESMPAPAPEAMYDMAPPAMSSGEVQQGGQEMDYAQQQREEIMSQISSRKGASRTGALPVRIEVPGGLDSLPKVEVSRMLAVGEKPQALRVWVFPGWLPPLLRLAQWACILIAGFLFAVAGAGELKLSRNQKTQWALGALVPYGGVPVWAALLVGLLVYVAVRFVLFVKRHLKSKPPAVPPPLVPPVT